MRFRALFVEIRLSVLSSIFGVDFEEKPDDAFYHAKILIFSVFFARFPHIFQKFLQIRNNVHFPKRFHG